MLVSDVIDHARLALNDQDGANYRWPTAVLLGYVNNAINAAFRRRPDLKLNDAGVLKNMAVVTALTDEIDMPDDTLVAFADHVCYEALVEDDPDKANADRAEWHYNAFTRLLDGA